MHGRLALVLLALPLAAASLSGQTVRGVVIDDSTKLPIASATVTLVNDAGADVLSVRSDSFGDFTIHAGRPGRYHVRAVRIGYRPLTSDRVSLGIGQLVALRLSMSSVAQELVPVRVVERRRLNLTELMSTTGFDLRQSKGVGTFVAGERLAAFGAENVVDVLNRGYRHLVYVRDSLDGSTLIMRRGMVGCLPEIYIDGVEISSGAPEEAMVGRAQNALAMLAGHPASSLHGIEIYRPDQVPPPSLGGFIGSGLTPSGRACGAVAVWTKAGANRLASARVTATSGIQVISGVILDFETERPVEGVPVRLLTSDRYAVADAVLSDSLGEFVIHTKRAGPVRLEAGSIGFQVATSAPFPIAAEELVIVRFFVSAKRPVMAPLGIAIRAGPTTYGRTDLGSFAYRRERGLTGVFFGATDIRRRGALTLAELLAGADGVRVAGSAPADTILLRDGPPGSARHCVPSYFVDGSRLTPAAGDSTVRSLSLERVFGIEVYRGPAEVPAVFADLAGECGLVGIWMNRE